MRGILRFGAPAALCVTAACGEVKALPDAAIDAAPPTSVYRWVINDQRLPTSNPQAVEYGLDLDGDGVVENRLGELLAALSSQGFSIPAATSAAIARGTILMLGEATVGGAGGPTAATFTLYTGANPQPPPCTGPNDSFCGRHLLGDATFDVAAGSARDQPLAGTLASSTLTAGPGALQVPVLIGNGAPLRLDLIGARVRLQPVTAGSLGQSVIAGAVTQAERDAKIYPGIHQHAATVIAADCPGMTPPDCSCAAGSPGRMYLNLFDTSPQNCVITLDEVRNHSLLMSLLTPDVTVGGQAALSFGFAVTAVRATFTP